MPHQCAVGWQKVSLVIFTRKCKLAIFFWSIASQRCLSILSTSRCERDTCNCYTMYMYVVPRRRVSLRTIVITEKVSLISWYREATCLYRTLNPADSNSVISNSLLFRTQNQLVWISFHSNWDKFLVYGSQEGQLFLTHICVLCIRSNFALYTGKHRLVTSWLACISWWHK